MPTPFPETITLSIKIQNILKQITNCTVNPYRLVRRAKIILEAANGVNNTIIAHKYDLSRCQVRYWRKKWQENYSRIIEAETEKLDDQKIQSIIIAIFDLFKPQEPNKILSSIFEKLSLQIQGLVGFLF